MRKYLTFRNFLLTLLVIFIVIQFFGIDKSTEPVDPDQDFLTLVDADPDLARQIRTSCYDCHSRQTVWPWYASVAPVSWWIADHVREARSHLNFSEWGSYDADRREHKLEECEHEVGDGHMPLRSYLWIHRHARLTDADRSRLAAWFRSQEP